MNRSRRRRRRVGSHENGRDRTAAAAKRRKRVTFPSLATQPIDLDTAMAELAGDESSGEEEEQQRRGLKQEEEHQGCYNYGRTAYQRADPAHAHDATSRHHLSKSKLQANGRVIVALLRDAAKRLAESLSSTIPVGRGAHGEERDNGFQSKDQDDDPIIGAVKLAVSMERHSCKEKHTAAASPAGARAPMADAADGKRAYLAAAGMTAAFVPPPATSSSSAIEVVRRAAVYRCGARLVDIATRLQVERLLPNDTFSNWCMSRKVIQRQRQREQGDIAAHNDMFPILPTGECVNEEDADFVTTLRECSAYQPISRDLARTVCVELGKACKKEVATLATRISTGCHGARTRKACRIEFGSDQPPQHGYGGSSNGGTLSGSRMVRVSYRKVAHRLNARHYWKLRCLYYLARLTTTQNSADRHFETRPSASDVHDERAEENAFRHALFCLSTRYSAATGKFTEAAGHHGALNPAAFVALQRHFGVSMEAFASPLNCHFPAFCSAFPDVDCRFGSMGSFFDFHPEQFGHEDSLSIEVNPPFVPSVMHAAVLHIDNLLEKAPSRRGTALPLLFVIIVPQWPQHAYWERLSHSQFLLHTIELPRADHGFCEGMQHSRRTQYRVATCNSVIFFLGNAAAAKKWPVTEKAERDVRLAFASKHSAERAAHRVFVGGVDASLNNHDMTAHFEQFGNVSGVFFPRDHSTGSRRGICFVTMDTAEAVQSAVEETSRTLRICGKAVRVVELGAKQQATSRHC